MVRAPVLAFGLALLAATLASDCGGDDAPRQATFGFNDNSVREGLVSPARSAALTRAAGGTVTRQGFDWRHAEPRRDVYDLGLYDRIYRASLRRGVRPLWIVVFAPAWACERPAACRGDFTVPPARRYDGEWREIVALLARRYPRSAGIEVWNEPNLRVFWHPAPDPGRYTQLLRAAYAAVKRVNPRMPVAGGGVNNLSETNRTGMGHREFLEAMYEAGARGAMDAISFHPYSTLRGEDLAVSSLDGVRAVRDAAGDRGTELWATEIGYSTTIRNPRRRRSEREQARALVADYRRLSRAGADMVLVHALQDGPNPPSAAMGHGLVRTDGTLKPAFCALARETGGRRPCRARARQVQGEGRPRSTASPQ